MASSFPRLAYIVNSLNLGGTESLVVRMSEVFSADYEISVICLDEPGLWAERLREKGIPVYCLWRQPGLDFNTAWRVARLAKKLGVEGLHAHQCTPWFYGALSRIFFKVPWLLFEEHGRFYPEVRNLKKNVVNRLVVQPLTNKIVAVSEDVKKRLHRYEGISFRRIEVVYNGTSPSRRMTAEERRGLREELGLAAEDFVVGSVGRIDPIKNYSMFVAALAAVSRHAGKIRGLLVGDGPEFALIRAQADLLGLGAAFRMPGYRADADRIIQCLDLFVLCSHSEGTSMALLEAMAAGVPAIVTDVGGNPEVVLGDETGWVIASGNTGGLTSAIREALEDSEKMERFADAGRKRYEEKFTFDMMIANYRKYYEELFRW